MQDSKNREIKNKLENFILLEILKPGRYLGNEINVINKSISSVDIRFALAFPDIYEIGMSSQAIHILYHLLNRIDFVWAERVFAPWTDMEEKLQQHDIPLFSLESFTPLHSFDVIGFTLQYELTYTNLLNMLHLSNIPLMSNSRKDNDPIIFAGGPCSCNPEPMADFIDAFYIGDAEEGVIELCSAIRQAKIEGIKRRELLNRLSKIRGIYIPSIFKNNHNSNGQLQHNKMMKDSNKITIKTRITPALKNEYYPEKPIVPLIEIIHDRLAIEVMRGCTQGCRFCNAGMVYRPVREKPVNDIVDYSQKAMLNSGYQACSFLSLSISDYPWLKQLFVKEREINNQKYINFSFPSMRLDNFNEEIANFAKEVRKSGLTFAPEAGSIRLRKVINKNITEEDLFNAVDIACKNGWKLFKFYFMIGLPTETKEDIEEIITLMKSLVRYSKKYGRIKFNISISPFVPKSHTPFQWEKQNTKEELWGKIILLKKHFHQMKEVNLSWRDPAISELECILGRGDRKLSQVIYSAWKKGAKFDGWTDKFRYNIWLDAFKKNNLIIEHYIKKIPENHPLPWDHIDKGVTNHFLKKERKKAYSQTFTENCKNSTCHLCGIQRKNSFAEYATCYQDSLSNHEIKNVGQINAQKSEPSLLKKNKGEVRIHLRIHYQKLGYAKYISHLDLIRLFGRIFRRSEINIAYTNGYNKRPKMSFGPALTLGHTSDAEYMDIEVNSAPLKNMKKQLNSILPEGIKIKQIKKINTHRLSLTSSISAMDYSIDLNNRFIESKDISKLIKRSSIPVSRKVKDRTKIVDIRPFIESINNINGKLHIRIKLINGQTGRMDEIIGQLIQKNIKTYPVHRVRQIIKTGTTEITPMEIP